MAPLSQDASRSNESREGTKSGVLEVVQDFPTSTFERVKYGKVRHESHQTPASGDTNSRKLWQVAGIQVLTVAPLYQESPGWPQKAACGCEPRRGNAHGEEPWASFLGRTNFDI